MLNHVINTYYSLCRYLHRDIKSVWFEDCCLSRVLILDKSEIACFYSADKTDHEALQKNWHGSWGWGCCFILVLVDYVTWIPKQCLQEDNLPCWDLGRVIGLFKCHSTPKSLDSLRCFLSKMVIVLVNTYHSRFSLGTQSLYSSLLSPPPNLKEHSGCLFIISVPFQRDHTLLTLQLFCGEI